MVPQSSLIGKSGKYVGCCLSQCAFAERAKVPRAKPSGQKPSRDLRRLRLHIWKYVPQHILHLVSMVFGIPSLHRFCRFLKAQRHNKSTKHNKSSPITLLKLSFTASFSPPHSQNCHLPSLFIEENLQKFKKVLKNSGKHKAASAPTQDRGTCIQQILIHHRGLNLAHNLNTILHCLSIF